MYSLVLDTESHADYCVLTCESSVQRSKKKNINSIKYELWSLWIELKLSKNGLSIRENELKIYHWLIKTSLIHIYTSINTFSIQSWYSLNVCDKIVLTVTWRCTINNVIFFWVRVFFVCAKFLHHTCSFSTELLFLQTTLINDNLLKITKFVKNQFSFINSYFQNTIFGALHC